jgi:hypothetical protein
VGVISVRFNQNEERILKELSEYYDEDRSKLVKKSIMEMYETLVDRKLIDKFEVKESKKKAHFHSADEMLKLIEGK